MPGSPWEQSWGPFFGHPGNTEERFKQKCAGYMAQARELAAKAHQDGASFGVGMDSLKTMTSLLQVLPMRVAEADLVLEQTCNLRMFWQLPYGQKVGLELRPDDIVGYAILPRNLCGVGHVRQIPPLLLSAGVLRAMIAMDGRGGNPLGGFGFGGVRWR